MSPHIFFVSGSNLFWKMAVILLVGEMPPLLASRRKNALLQI
jgi:hypothetical protein